MSAGRKVSLVLTSSVLGALMGFGILLVVGRTVAPAAYGSYLFAMSLTGILGVLSNIGLGSAHQHAVASGKPLDVALGVLVRMRAAAGTILVGGFVLLFAAWTALTGRALTDATSVRVLAIALGLQLTSGVRQLLMDTWQGQQKVNRVEVLKAADTTLSLVLVGLVGLSLAHASGRWEPIPSIGAWGADLLGLQAPVAIEDQALLVGGAYLVAKLLTLVLAAGLAARESWTVGPWDRELALSYLRFAAPLAMSGGLLLVLQYTDTLLLGIFWTSREVGHYGAAQKLVSLCLLASTAASVVLFPRFARLHAQGRHQEAEATFRSARRYLTLAVAPLVAAMVALPRAGLHVAVGDPYLPAAPALRFLALWAFVVAMEQLLTTRLTATGRSRIVVQAVGLNAALNVVLNLVLIPPWALGMGAAGAALATLLSSSASLLWLLSSAHREYGTPRTDSAQVRALAAGLAPLAVWLAIDRWAPASWTARVWGLAACGVLGLLAYLAALALTRATTKADLEFVKAAAHPSQLLAELRGR